MPRKKDNVVYPARFQHPVIEEVTRMESIMFTRKNGMSYMNMYFEDARKGSFGNTVTIDWPIGTCDMDTLENTFGVPADELLMSVFRKATNRSNHVPPKK